MIGRLTHWGVFLATILVNLTACAIRAEETTASSQLPLPVVVAQSAEQAPSPETQFAEIQKILRQIDKASEKTRIRPQNRRANSPRKGAGEFGRTTNAGMMPTGISSNQTRSARGKGKMKQMNKGRGKMKQMNRSMMGKRPASQATRKQAGETLPGFPQAPHLYHIGEAEFFLDHKQQISLSNQQSESLTRIQGVWATQRESIDAQIVTLEESLWQATAQGEPDIVDIRKKVAEIGELNGQLRLTFITSVGRAVGVLTAEQVALLMRADNQP